MPEAERSRTARADWSFMFVLCVQSQCPGALTLTAGSAITTRLVGISQRCGRSVMALRQEMKDACKKASRISQSARNPPSHPFFWPWQWRGDPATTYLLAGKCIRPLRRKESTLRVVYSELDHNILIFPKTELDQSRHKLKSRCQGTATATARSGQPPRRQTMAAAADGKRPNVGVVRSIHRLCPDFLIRPVPLRPVPSRHGGYRK